MIPDPVLIGFLFIVTGLFSGLAAGVFGIGGGMIVVPALFYIFKLSDLIPSEYYMHVAAGSSLAIMIFTAASAVGVHYLRGAILWDLYQKLWFWILVGTISGGVLAHLLSTYGLRIIFGVFLVLIGLKLLSDVKVTIQRNVPNAWINRFICYLIGLKSGLLGIGGGALMIPYLTYTGIEPHKIPAVSSLCTLTVALAGTCIFMLTGQSATHLPTYTIGYIYWPAVVLVTIPSVLLAPLGVRLSYVLPVRQLKYGFVFILWLAAINLLI